MAMSEEIFIKCIYCGELNPLDGDAKFRHDFHPGGCLQVLDNPRPGSRTGCFTCYCCNTTEGLGTTGKKIKSRFTDDQRRLGFKARCKTCVGLGIERRRPPFLNYRDESPSSKLCSAIRNFDIDRVSKLLDQGEDPNYSNQQSRFINGRLYYFWRSDGSPLGERALDPAKHWQCPTMPLPRIGYMMKHADVFELRHLAILAKILID